MTQTPAAPGNNGRNAWLDAMRTVAVLRVVIWHTYGSFWISYFIASMPVMFFVSGALMARSLRRGNPLEIVYRRFKRLLPPFWVLGVVAIGVMLAYDHLSESLIAHFSARDIAYWILPIWDPRGSEWGLTLWAPLWYLRAVSWLLLASPLLIWLWRRVGPALLIVPLTGLAITEQRFQAGGTVPWQLQDAALFGFFWLLGFAYDDGLLARIARSARALLCGAFIIVAAFWALTQDVPGHVVNASYPLHLMVGLAWLFGALTFERPIASFAASPLVSGIIYRVNERALTIYLWHTAGLFCMYQLLWAEPHSSIFRNTLALPIVACVTFLAVFAFGWLEDVAAGRSPRLWPARGAPAAPARPPPVRPVGVLSGAVLSVAVVALLLAAARVGDEPSRLVQPTAQTVPASGVGLALRARNALVMRSPPPSPPPYVPGEAPPVSREEFQSDLNAWQAKWQLGATATILRPSGEEWSGAVGDDLDGAVLRPSEQYWTGSVTKSFTAALIMRLVERELVGLDDAVSKYVPDFPQADRFTVRQLIQHTSGLISGGEYPDSALEEAAAEGLQYAPGEAWLYSRVGYYLLGLVVEDAMGEPFTRALHDELLDPLGLQSTLMDEEIEPLPFSTHPYRERGDDVSVRWTSGGLYRDLRPQFDYFGIHWSSGGLYSTTPDLARWALALWGSSQVVSGSTLDQMTTFLPREFDFTGLGTWAACPCWLEGDRLRADRWSHLGATGAIEYDPVDKVALAFHVGATLDDPRVIEALDDLSMRLRTLVRGRRFQP